jgi:H+/gluconate symporter-like permease
MSGQLNYHVKEGLTMLGIIIMLVFFIIVLLIIFRKLPVMLALPLIAFITPVIAGVPLIAVFNDIIGTGSYSMASTLVAIVFGVMLGMVMKKCNITRP